MCTRVAYRVHSSSALSLGTFAVVRFTTFCAALRKVAHRTITTAWMGGWMGGWVDGMFKVGAWHVIHSNDAHREQVQHMNTVIAIVTSPSPPLGSPWSRNTAARTVTNASKRKVVVVHAKNIILIIPHPAANYVTSTPEEVSMLSLSKEGKEVASNAAGGSFLMSGTVKVGVLDKGWTVVLKQGSPSQSTGPDVCWHRK